MVRINVFPIELSETKCKSIVFFVCLFDFVCETNCSSIVCFYLPFVILFEKQLFFNTLFLFIFCYFIRETNCSSIDILKQNHVREYRGRHIDDDNDLINKFCFFFSILLIYKSAQLKFLHRQIKKQMKFQSQLVWKL